MRKTIVADSLSPVKCDVTTLIPCKNIDQDPVHYIPHETCSTLDKPEGQKNRLHGQCDYEDISAVAVTALLYEQISNFHNHLDCMGTRANPQLYWYLRPAPAVIGRKRTGWAAALHRTLLPV